MRKKPLKQLKFFKDVYLLMEFHNIIIIIYYYRQRRRRRSNHDINIIISRKMHQQRLQYIARMHVLHIFAKFNSWYMFIYLLTAFDVSLALTRSLCNSIMVYLWIQMNMISSHLMWVVKNDQWWEGLENLKYVSHIYDVTQ